MEAAKIDWGNLESVFIVDHIYEDINAPQWVDLLSPPSPSSNHHHDDVAWFCRPDCKHPRTADDFLNSTTSSSSKLLRSVSVSKLIGLVDWRSREHTLKRRGGTGIAVDCENQDPNLLTPNHQIKASIKSSASKDDDHSDISLSISSGDTNNSSTSRSRLKPSHSAKDLFGAGVGVTGTQILSKFTDFCNELKNKMASTRPLPPIQQQHKQDKEKQQMPLLDVTPSPGNGNGNSKLKKNKIKRPAPAPAAADANANANANAENMIPIDLNIMKPLAMPMENQNHKLLLSIRTNPPTPQGFSNRRERNRDPLKTTPSKSKLNKDREILGDQVHKKTEKEEEVVETPTPKNTNTGEEGRTLDVFWFLKPCTLSS